MPEPITLDQAKAQLRAEGTTADDAYIDDLIVAAREHVEQYCGIRLTSSLATMSFARFDDLARLTLAPVTAVSAVTYVDASGTDQTLDPAIYELVNVNDDPLRPMLQLAFAKNWPSAAAAVNAVQVAATVGYAAVPTPILRAMLVLITHWYDNRSGVAVDVRGTPTELPHAVTALLTNYRR